MEAGSTRRWGSWWIYLESGGQQPLTLTRRYPYLDSPRLPVHSGAIGEWEWDESSKPTLDKLGQGPVRRWNMQDILRPRVPGAAGTDVTRLKLGDVLDSLTGRDRNFG